MAGPSHSALSVSGIPAGPSHAIQAASGMAGTGGQTGGMSSQPTGVPSRQGSGLSTGALSTRMQLSGGSSGSSSRGGGSGGGGGGGGPPGPLAPPGRQAVVQGAPVAGPLPVANRALRGHPPEIFDGQRKNTQKFVKEFTLWKMCNL